MFYFGLVVGYHNVPSLGSDIGNHSVAIPQKSTVFAPGVGFSTMTVVLTDQEDARHLGDS